MALKKSSSSSCARAVSCVCQRTVLVEAGGFTRKPGCCKQDTRSYGFLWQTSQTHLHAELGHTAPWKSISTSAICSQSFSPLPIILLCNKCTGGLHYLRKLLAFVQFSRESWPPLHKALTAFMSWICSYWRCNKRSQTLRVGSRETEHDKDKAKPSVEGAPQATPQPMGPAERAASPCWDLLHPSHPGHTFFTKLLCMAVELKLHSLRTFVNQLLVI